MGFFSFMYADTNNNERLKIGGKAYIPLPSGNYLYEPHYNGYGMFNGKDIYYMFAMWNKDYLSADLVDELYEPPKRENYKNIYFNDTEEQEENAYQNALKRYELDKDTFIKFIQGEKGKYDVDFDDVRDIGIELFFSDSPKIKTAIKYPIKVMKNESSCKEFENYPGSEDDPMQGCD